MRRKVIQIANSTKLVSLPKKWCETYKVKKGDEIEVKIDGNKLLILSGNASHIDEILVDVSGLTPRLVDRFLARSYQKGYDRITLRFSTEEQLISIRNKVKELLGFEIMDVKRNECLIQTISTKLEINVETTIRKAFMVVLDMADTCLDAYKKEDDDLLNNLYLKDFDANKFCYYSLRAINKEKSGGFGTYILYYLIETLEDVGDAYKKLGMMLSGTKSKKEIQLILEKTNQVFRLGYEFFYNPQTKTGVQASEMYNSTKKEIKECYSKLKPAELEFVSEIHHILRLVYHYWTMRLDTLQELKNKKKR